MKNWLASYKSTLKDLEDVLDLVFNRFPAYLIVRIAAPLKISPNALTAMSFLLTCLATWSYGRGRLGQAALFIYLKVVFDCSDGQLARYAKITSPHGRFYDEVADISGQFLLMGGIGYEMMRMGFSWPVFLSLCASLFFLGADITIFQNFRTYYARTYDDRKAPVPAARTSRSVFGAAFAVIHGLDALREWTTRLVPVPDINAYARKNGLSADRKDALRAAFRRRFRPVVYAFSLVAGTSHLFSLAVISLLNRLEWIFPLFILWYNLTLAALIVFQIVNVALFKRRYMPRLAP